MSRMMRLAEANSTDKMRALWGLAILLVVAVSGLKTANPLVAAVVAGLSFYFILAPLGLFLFLRGLYLLITKRKLISLKPAFFAGLFYVLVVLVFYQSNEVASRWETRRIETFVSKAAITLDQIKAKTRKYPAKLPAELQRSMPRILTYSSNGKRFSFDYSWGLSPHGYDSETHSWWSD